MTKGTDSVGFASFITDLTYNEIHLFWMGLYCGFVAIRPGARNEPKSSQKEMLKWDVNHWYWKTGYVAGYTVKAVVGGNLAVGKLAGLV